MFWNGKRDPRYAGSFSLAMRQMVAEIFSNNVSKAVSERLLDCLHLCVS